MKVHFLRELKRRRVLNTAWFYVIGAWIALQVVEVLSEVGLPPSTMRTLLIVLSAGFPLALIIGWFFDISRVGIVRTRPIPDAETLPSLTFLDYLLLTGLLAVVVVDAWILSLPPAEEAPLLTVREPAVQRTVAVLAFGDVGPIEEGQEIGETYANELRSSLTRIAGLRVLGPETSKALTLAKESRIAMARELRVTTLLTGEVSLDGGRVQINTRLVGVPTGNELWSAQLERPVSEAVDLQNELVRQIVQTLAPDLDADPAQGPRVEAGACSEVYDLYLRGKQLSKARRKAEARSYQRGMELLREAVALDAECALAWEAIATGELEWTKPALARASAAARRALELNPVLPDAWSVLAEVAEEEERWSQAEEYYLRALYADPTNARANYMYSETLLARGRHGEALRYVLEAYRYEPVSLVVNFRIALTALYANRSDLVIKHAEIYRDITGSIHAWLWDLVAEARLQMGDTQSALEAYAEISGSLAPWFTDCVKARENPESAPAIRAAMHETLGQFEAGVADSQDWAWNMIRCGTWMGDPDLVFEVLDLKGIPPYESGWPTEAKFSSLFHYDGAVVRQHPRFRSMVVESGLLDYWKKWGWADMCRPDGESFQCD